jgi:tetratricopeptide (TPR) repeat protein
MQRELGDRVGIAISLGNLGEIARLQGELTQALALHEEGLALQRDLGDRHSLALSLLNLGAVADDLGDRERAAALYEESLLLSREIGARDRQAEGLERLAWLTASGWPQRAAQLGGAADALRASLGMPLAPALSASHAAALETMRAALGEEAFAVAWAEGRALTLEDAVALALTGQSEGESARMPTRHVPDGGTPLNSREPG